MKKYTAGYPSAPNAPIHGHRYRQQVYEHSLAGMITENEEVKILWAFTIQTDHEMNHRRHDVTVHDNNNRVNSDFKICNTEDDGCTVETCLEN